MSRLGLDGIVDAKIIAATVDRLGVRITRDYQDLVSDSNPLVVLCVLKGGIVFTADLIRHIGVPVQLEFIAAESYVGIRQEEIRIFPISTITYLGVPLKNRHVLLVDAIVDSGRTGYALWDHISQREPESIRMCALLRKQTTPLSGPDYYGIEIPDRFVVGYGMDHNGLYRNLSEIYEL